MGNQPSSAQGDGKYDPNALFARDESLQPEEETYFMNHMVNGCETHIVFADGSSLPCSVIYDLAEDCLHLQVDDKRRVIALSDVEEILGVDNVEGLSNVDKALIIDAHIVAFRLSSTKKAILLRFNDLKESKGFYHFLKEIIQENAEKAPNPELLGADETAEEEEPNEWSQTIIF
ncbi:hypothetical protein, conserved [Babesia bigemina]|uniref:ISP3 C-terminal domain-containing protein n=1 Tax=Babesia bigemina TaxID=5866 RepID=A0A061D7Z5_BABBI|nr:hypothetical protein, conserved [Babesia bigemina]CDR93820.1 hypothetical protein, conserved [Babesia bigemina]|eukprot:XP_012766006.1 hypothetical protein, conserved [Babesia bigemina]